MALVEGLGDEAVIGEAFNFSTESPMTVLELVQKIRDLLDCGHIEPEVLGSATGEIRAQHLSASKAGRLFSCALKKQRAGPSRRFQPARRSALLGAARDESRGSRVKIQFTIAGSMMADMLPAQRSSKASRP